MVSKLSQILKQVLASFEEAAVLEVLEDTLRQPRQLHFTNL